MKVKVGKKTIAKQVPQQFSSQSGTLETASSFKRRYCATLGIKHERQRYIVVFLFGSFDFKLDKSGITFDLGSCDTDWLQNKVQQSY